jgi:hypothetical protein
MFVGAPDPTGHAGGAVDIGLCPWKTTKLTRYVRSHWKIDLGGVTKYLIFGIELDNVHVAESKKY